MKDIITMIAFSLAVFGSLSGCSGNNAGDSRSPSPTLTRATNETKEKKAMQYRDAMDGVVSYVPPVGANSKPANTSISGAAR